MIGILRAFVVGLLDGWESPRALSAGVTWDDPRLNEAYDHGVNFGQRVRSPLHHERGR